MSTALSAIDLTDVEHAVYAEIVTDQPIDLDRLITSSGVPEGEVRLAVGRMLRDGLISRVRGKQEQFVASPPDVALGALLLEREEQLKRARLQVDQLASLYRRAATVADDPASLMEVVTGREAVMRYFTQLQSGSRSEIRLIDKPPYVANDPHANVALERELVSRGITFRAIYDSLGLETFHDMAGDVQDSVAAGVEARVMPEAPLKLMLIDDRLAMIPMRNAPNEIEGVVVVRSSALLDALSVFFDQLWDRALPLILPDDVGGVEISADTPTRDERRLLSLLTAGLPDEVIAKHLGVSHRTMQRRLRTLLDRLGAETRFQAALRAVSLGWLPLPSSGQTDSESDVAIIRARCADRSATTQAAASRVAS